MKWIRGFSPHLFSATILFLLLPVLAFLQYRWLVQLQEQDLEQRKGTLNAAAGLVADQVDRELTRVFLAFQTAVMSGTRESMGLRLHEVQRAHAMLGRGLVARIWLISGGSRYTLNAGEFVESFADAPDWDQRLGAGPGLAMPRILGGIPLGIALPYSGTEREQPEWVVIELDGNQVEGRLLAAMVKKYAGPEHAAAIVARSDPSRILFQSENFTDVMKSEPDARAGIYRLRLDSVLMLETQSEEDSGQVRKLAAMQMETEDRLAIRLESASGSDSAGESGGEWQLLLSRRNENLDQLVARAHRRNWILSFGILALLGTAVVFLLVAARRAQQLAQRQLQFVAGVSHELRTPLAVIRSAGENLADALIRDPDRIRMYGALIRREGIRLSEMVENLLQYAGIHSGRTNGRSHIVKFRELIEQSIEAGVAADPETRVRIQSSLDPALPDGITADGAALRSAIKNLIENAAKYSPEGSPIQVEAARDQRNGEQQIRISVRNGGSGIPAEELQLIFEPFYRGKQAIDSQTRGAGLGLSLARLVVKRHGGSIDVSSAPGQGACFTIRLPLPSNRPQEAAKV